MANPSIPHATLFEQSPSVTIPLSEVVFDPSIYPRSGLDSATVARYIDAYAAGEVLPPIILERGTNRLFDGRHRYQARLARQSPDVEVEYHTLPDGCPPKLYCAELSAAHGLPITEIDMRIIAREVYSAGDDATIADVARRLHRAHSTVEAWVFDIRQERRNAEARDLNTRRMMVLLLREMGWTQQQIADLLGMARTNVTTIVSHHETGMTDNLNEAILQSAINRLPEDVVLAAEEIAEQWRQQRLFSQWTDEERELVTRLRDGETVVLNMSQNGHPRLWAWAEQMNLAVKIDRNTEWGNPFHTPADGDRDTVLHNYRTHFWPYKPSLHSQIRALRGKALGCWCAPKGCHGHFLKEEAERDP